jgi:hypothetical protein
MQEIDQKKRKRGRKGRDWTKMLVKIFKKMIHEKLDSWGI